MNKKYPLISVLMAYYDNIEYVEDSLLSVCEQTYKNWELIVVDDCSPSIEAKELIKSLAEKYGFKLITNIANKGAGKSFQIAFEQSRGDYISLISHDDLYTKDKLQHMLDIVEAKNLDALYCNGAVFNDNDSKNANPFDTQEVLSALKINKQEVANLISSKDTVGCLLTQGGLYKRQIFSDLAWMREKFLLDDWPFTIKVWRDYKTFFDERVVYLYRSHQNNIHKKYWKWFPARIQTIAELIDEEKKVEVTSFMMLDVANSMQKQGRHEDAFHFALASYFMSENQSTIYSSKKFIINSIKDKKLKKQLSKKIKSLNFRKSFLYGPYKLFIKLGLILVFNKEKRKKLRNKLL